MSENSNVSSIENVVSKDQGTMMEMNQQIKGLYSLINPMVQWWQGQQPQHLENCTNGTQNYLLSEMKGADQMAHKYQQRVEVMDNGKKVIKWATGETQEEFQKSLFDILTKNNKYTPAPAIPSSDRAWDEYAWEWFDTYKVHCFRSSKTATTRKCFMKNYVVPAFGNKPIASITKKDVQAALNRNSHLSKDYMRDIMNYMKGIFRAAVDDDIISKNPMDSDLIKNPCKRVAHRDALTEDEKADIIAHISELKKDVDKAFMAFLMYTPMRPGEIFALTWEDVDFDNNVIQVLRGSSFDNGKILMGEDGETKTGWDGVRTIPLHEGLKAYLLPMRQASGVILCRDRKGYEGEPFSEQAAKCQWKRIKKQIDVHGMTPYVGRHTYLTEVLHNGATIDTAMKMAGHKDERMLTRHYLHANDKHVRAAGDVMEFYFKRLGTV